MKDRDYVHGLKTQIAA
jgi:hypothetical protein